MQYRKKPVVIEAVQLTENNAEEISAFVGKECRKHYDNDFPTENTPYMGLQIATLEGVMLASIGDYIIKGVKGEFYPCKPDIFEQTYEKVEP